MSDRRSGEKPYVTTGQLALMFFSLVGFILLILITRSMTATQTDCEHRERLARLEVAQECKNINQEDDSDG